MDEKQNKRKFLGRWLLTLAVLLPLVWIGGQHYLNSPKVCARMVQKSVQKIEKEIQTLVDNNADDHQYDKAEVCLFIYNKDSLLYWNNNLVGPKLIRRKVAKENDTIINLLTGDYYVKSFRKGHLDYYAFKLLNTTYKFENQYFENRFFPFHNVIKNKITFHSKEGIEIRTKDGKLLSHCQIENRKKQITPTGCIFLSLDVVLLIVAVVLLLPPRKQKITRISSFSLEYGIVAILIAAVLLTYLYYNTNRKRENKEMATLAENLLLKRDPTFEASYQKFIQELKADTNIRQMVFGESNVLSEVILGYSNEFLFDAKMKEYEVTLTICAPNEEIAVQPDDYVTSCEDYFVYKLANNKQSKVGEDLYFIDYYTLDPNYLGKITIEALDTAQQRTLYLEFYKPIAPEGFGFPQLLQEEHSEKPYSYSVANYRDNVLVYKYGKYIYPNFYNEQKGKDRDFNYTRGYKHYTLKKDDNNILIISTMRKGWAEVTAPFAKFLLLLLIPYLIIYWAMTPKEKRLNWKGSFRQRLQSIVLLTLALSFFIIGPISALFLNSLYNKKTMEARYETTRTLANEINNDLDIETLVNTASRNTWTNLLQHYATTFYTDLNLYSLDGRLIATTRQEIYELVLQAPIMNARAYQNMHHNKALYFTQEEHLGKGKYESSYIPLIDKQGNTLAYLNTPYFSSATDLRNEILNFVLTYINIILLLLGVALLLVLSITKYITKPLGLLQEKMGDIKIDRKNEPIEWKGNDEIGALIKQYNELIVELEKSAAELKRTTTESAWRGVARQVAHEIKNSLTPMRLSVQMLQRSIEKGDKNVEEKVKRTTATLIEQIDSLSDIASSFSTYAKLPENHPAPLDLAELVGNVVNLYDNTDNIEFTYDYDATIDYTFNGDKTNLNIAVSNLIKNAVQAIGSKADGKIEVRLKAEENQFVISVKDNGKGIEEEDKGQIFLPNFTTKTNGSGVGLSLTYNIVQAAKGSITFESKVGEGTKFVIELPK